MLAGPWIGQTIADLAPEVIKVESPQVAADFHVAKRGKTSVNCAFGNPDDLESLKTLIAEADVLIENFKVGGLKKYGLDYPAMAALNPRLVYASITGFGQTGPRSGQAGYDFLIQGLSGIMDLTGDPTGEPQKVGVAWIDVFTGLYGVIGIQAALAERARSGRGQHVDLALFDTGLAVLANQATNHLIGGTEPRRLGNAHPNIVPYQVFPASDGHLIIACGNDRQFRALTAELRLAHLADDPDFATNPARVANRDRLSDLLSAATAKRTRTDLIAALDRAGVPAGPINRVSEALSDPQAKARGMVIAPEGLAGLRTPILFSRSDLDTTRAAPLLGQGAWTFRDGSEG